MISEDRIFKPTEVKIADWSKKAVIRQKVNNQTLIVLDDSSVIISLSRYKNPKASSNPP